MPAQEAFQQLFTEQIDICTDEEMVEEMYWSMIGRHPFHILDQTITKNIYGEPATEADIDGAYTTLDPEIPIHIKLDPDEEYLEKYGYHRKRDMIAWFSSKILRDRGLNPKVGDRIDFRYTDSSGGATLEHFIITETSTTDFLRHNRVPYQLNVGCMRTQFKKQP